MRKLLYFVALVVIVTGVSARQRKAKGPTVADVRKADYIYNASLPSNIEKSMDVYFDMLQQAYTIDSTDRTLQGEYGFLLSILGNTARNDTMFDTGLRLARKAFMANTADLQYGRRYLDFLSNLGEDSLALDAIRLMRQRDPLNKELLQISIAVKKPKYYVSDTAVVYDVLGLIDTLEMAHGVTSESVSERATLYLMLDDTQRAKQTVSDFYQKNKRDRGATLMMMNMYNYLGEPDSVISIGEPVHQETPTDLENVNVLANAYLAKGDTTRYLSMLHETMLNDQLPPEILAQLVYTFAKELMGKEGIEKAGYPMITDTYTTLVKSHPYDDELMKDYIGWMQYIGAETSTSILEDYVNLHPSELEMWVKLIAQYMEQGQQDNAMDACNRAERYFPDAVGIPVVRGRLYLMMNPQDTVSAIREFIHADSLASDTVAPSLRSTIKGALGDLAVAKGDTAKGISLYREAILLQPDNYMMANNLAYILAVQNTNLLEARVLIERCMRYNPEESIWLDTYAWVLYRQGEYEEAAKQIDAAIRQMANIPDDEMEASEISATYDHAGDIYFMKGDVDTALKNWKRALVYAPGDEVLIRKIKTKKIEP